MSNAETALYQQIIDALAATGLADVVRVQSGKVQVRRGWMQLAPRGTPDLLGHAANGVGVALEVKAPGGKERPEQTAYLARARARGAYAGTVTSPVEAVQFLLVALGRKR